MNREAVPLLVAIIVPCLFVLILLFYFYGYDITVFLRKIDLIYYIILLPFVLGLLAALMKLRKE